MPKAHAFFFLIFVIAFQAHAADAPATPPSDGNQVQDLLSLSHQVTPDQMGDAFDAAKTRQDAEHATHEQYIAWTIDELRKIAAANARNPASTQVARPTGHFSSAVTALRIFSPTSGIAVTQNGIMATDGSLARWKGVAGFDHPMGMVTLVGAWPDMLYFITMQVKEVVVQEGFDPPPGHEHDRVYDNRITRGGKNLIIRNDYTFALWRWTPAAGFVQICVLPHGQSDPRVLAACDFATQRIGAYVDGDKLMITRDAAATWIETALPSDQGPAGVMQIKFVADDKLAISSPESIALMQIDEGAHARPLWRSPIFGRIDDSSVPSPQRPPMTYDSSSKLLWLYSVSPVGSGQRLEAFDLDHGAVSQSFDPAPPTEHFISYALSPGRIYAYYFGPHGGDFLRIWDISAPTPQAIHRIEVENNMSHITDALPVPASDDLYLCLYNQTLILWDGQPVIPGFSPSRIRRPFVDTSLLEAAEDNWPPGTEPSRRDSAALFQAMKGLNGIQIMQISSEAQERHAQFSTNREQILWQTKRAVELKAATAASQPATAPATSPAIR